MLVLLNTFPKIHIKIIIHKNSKTTIKIYVSVLIFTVNVTLPIRDYSFTVEQKTL